MFYGCFYSIVLNSQIYFCLVLRKSKEGWRPLRLCLGQRKKKCKLSVQLEALNTPALMSQTCQRVKMESRNSQGTLWKKSPWERSALAKVKRSLDDAALERLTPRARANFLPRRGHTHQSDRQRPLDSLDWAVRPPPASTYTSIQSTRLLKSGRDPIIIKIKGSRDPIAINQDSDSSSHLDDCFATYSCGFDIKWYTTSQHYTTKKEGMSNDNFARILDTERFLSE